MRWIKSRARWTVSVALAGIVFSSSVFAALQQSLNQKNKSQETKEQARKNKIDRKYLEIKVGKAGTMKLVQIKSGKFLMGSSKTEQKFVAERIGDWSDLVKGETQHEVEITKPFYMGIYEVTQTEYETIMGENPSFFSPTGLDKDKVKGLDTSRFPVDAVDWREAMEFCKKLSAKVGKNFDLPTEAEWEYACRAGTKGHFHYGDSLSCKQANIGGAEFYFSEEEREKEKPLKRTTTVGSYEPNAFGLYDMHGNVAEWCKDFEGGRYTDKPVKDPQGPSKSLPVIDPKYERHVIRGGTYGGPAWACRSSMRLPSDSRYWGGASGFRVVCRD